MIELSVIICTYNPNAERLNRTLAGLRNQTLALNKWELIIIDNNSSTAVSVDTNWHPNSSIIPEPKAGLTYARLKGFSRAVGQIMVLVDDDNILDENYLLNTLKILNTHPKIGAIGGKILPEFEETPPTWLNQFYSLLAIRDEGDSEIISEGDKQYPKAAPVGAGMAIRKAAVNSYITKVNKNNSPVTDRQGSSLSSGGDNDLVMEVVKQGWQVGYFPSLSLTHIIPAGRIQADYLAQLNYSSNKSWIKVLQNHNINPWPKIAAWTVALRKAKAWFAYKAWIKPVNYIKWRGACGMFEALAND